jgi:hypothetical protein
LSYTIKFGNLIFQKGFSSGALSNVFHFWRTEDPSHGSWHMKHSPFPGTERFLVSAESPDWGLGVNKYQLFVFIFGCSFSIG